VGEQDDAEYLRLLEKHREIEERILGYFGLTKLSAQTIIDRI
jgi:uncharacterized protein YdcH (DUF465 family)